MKLANHHTRQALQRLYEKHLAAEEQVWAGVDREQARRIAGEARRRVLDDLAAYLHKLEEAARANGARVHRAETAQDANRIIIGLLRERGAAEALRNHAPLLDEIALDEAAAANDIAIIPVHPGAFLTHLSETAPQHPVWPAIHLRLADISEIMQEKLRVPATFDIHILSGHVRARVRAAFFHTKTAILGLQFAVAENAALVCLDNDGHNANLMAHADHLICVMGMEQVVADMTDLHHLIGAYARGAWAAAMPAYVAQILGPNRIEGRLPAVDLIIVDNNRTRVLAAGFGEALQCIQCGACHTVCPVFRQMAAAGYSPHPDRVAPYSGPIGAVLNPLMLRGGLADEQPFLSTDCRACNVACPVNIDLTGLLQRQRVRMAPTISRDRTLIRLWRSMMSRPRWLPLFLRAVAYTRRKQ